MLKSFSEINTNYLLCEMHTHSTWTDGQVSLADLTAKAVEHGLKRLFFTDHIRSTSNYFEDYLLEARELAQSSELDIKVGFESKVADYDGNLDIPKTAEEQADLIIGTVHSIPKKDEFVHPSLLAEYELEKAEYELSLAMISAKSADIMGHAGGMSIAKFGGFKHEYLEDIIAQCSENGVAFEINFRYHADIMDWLMEKLKLYNPLISIGSDVHSLDEVGVCSKIMLQKWKKLNG